MTKVSDNIRCDKINQVILGNIIIRTKANKEQLTKSTAKTNLMIEILTQTMHISVDAKNANIF